MRKRTKRKVYALVNPIQHAIEGVSYTPEHLLNKLRLGELSALDAMTRGGATTQDWQTLVDMMNVCETMARSGIGPEAIPAVETMQQEMIAAAKRYEKTRKMGLTGTGIKAAREVFAYHDVQRNAITRGEYEKMIEKTRNVVRSKGKFVRDVK